MSILQGPKAVADRPAQLMFDQNSTAQHKYDVYMLYEIATMCFSFVYSFYLDTKLVQPCHETCHEI